MKHHLENTGTPVTEQAVHDIYVDNIISGVNTTDETTQFYKETKQSFKEASMNIGNWGSNSRDFLKTFFGRWSQSTSYFKSPWYPLGQEARQSDDSESKSRKKKQEVLTIIASVYHPLGDLSQAMSKMNVLPWNDMRPISRMDKAVQQFRWHHRNSGTKACSKQNSISLPQLNYWLSYLASDVWSLPQKTFT